MLPRPPLPSPCAPALLSPHALPAIAQRVACRPQRLRPATIPPRMPQQALAVACCPGVNPASQLSFPPELCLCPGLSLLRGFRPASRELHAAPAWRLPAPQRAGPPPSCCPALILSPLPLHRMHFQQTRTLPEPSLKHTRGRHTCEAAQPLLSSPWFVPLFAAYALPWRRHVPASGPGRIAPPRRPSGCRPGRQDLCFFLTLLANPTSQALFTPLLHLGTPGRT